jgi:hypothetical protein
VLKRARHAKEREGRERVAAVEGRTKFVSSKECVCACGCGESFVRTGNRQVFKLGHRGSPEGKAAPDPALVDGGGSLKGLRRGVPVGVKFDQGKARWDLFPFSAAEKIVDVLAYGAKKYGANNWKRVPQAESRYFAACLRHLTSWIEGGRYDRESGLSHIAHAACSMLFILHGEKAPPTEKQ